MGDLISKTNALDFSKLQLSVAAHYYLYSQSSLVCFRDMQL